MPNPGRPPSLLQLSFPVLQSKLHVSSALSTLPPPSAPQADESSHIVFISETSASLSDSPLVAPAASNVSTATPVAPICSLPVPAASTCSLTAPAASVSLSEGYNSLPPEGISETTSLVSSENFSVAPAASTMKKN